MPEDILKAANNNLSKIKKNILNEIYQVRIKNSLNTDMYALYLSKNTI